MDENTASAIADQLRRIQPQMIIHNIGDETAPPAVTLDSEILIWLEKEGFSLVTRNRKSMPQHLKDHLSQGHHDPGIFTIRPNASMGDIIDDLF